MSGDTCEPQRQANGVERAVNRLESELDKMSAREFLDRVFRDLFAEGDRPFHIHNISVFSHEIC